MTIIRLFGAGEPEILGKIYSDNQYYSHHLLTIRHLVKGKYSKGRKNNK